MSTFLLLPLIGFIQTDGSIINNLLLETIQMIDGLTCKNYTRRDSEREMCKRGNERRLDRMSHYQWGK